jgi:hypothetical protein
MGEFTTNVYFKHDDPKIHKKFDKLYKTIRSKLSEEKVKSNIVDVSKTINKEVYEALTEKLFLLLAEYDGTPSDLVATSKSSVAGYTMYTFVHGNNAEYVVELIVKLLGRLDPTIDARACMAGDDEPWEIFFRWHNGECHRRVYEPEYEEAMRKNLPKVYNWWHKGLPEDIKDGFIN